MKKAKKGFTLAELLIVVAIIAVLTAIAVPLFVGALNNADTNVADANVRAVRATAVTKILEDQQGTTHTFGDGKNGWEVRAVVSANGAITSMDISSPEAAATIKEDKATKQSDGTYKVEVLITELKGGADGNITHSGAFPT